MKHKKFTSSWILILAILLLSGGGNVFAQEEALFTSVAPDALIILDLSSSMSDPPAGPVFYTLNDSHCDQSSPQAFHLGPIPNYTYACDTSAWSTIPRYAINAAACQEGPYYLNPAGRVPCSRLPIAKQAIFDILDDNNSTTITSADETSLGVRFGYMRFSGCLTDELGGDYTSGCNRLIWGISSRYSRIFCNSPTSCSLIGPTAPSVNSETISSEMGSPLASVMNEAKLYLDAHKAADSARDCRQKFAILITDGEDTYACNGLGYPEQTDQYKRRRATVARAKALADAGYRTFVIGFGSYMPHWVKNTLNWAAFYGGTDNPGEANSGDPGAFIPSGDFCADSDTASHNEGEGDHFHAVSNDPGEKELRGYAFTAMNPRGIKAALRQAMDMIRESTYSFSLSSVSSQRTQDENYLYEASFQPRNHDSFWFGHLKKYVINADGTIGGQVWDAGGVLQNTDAGARVIRTLIGGSVVDFTTTNISPAILGFTDIDPAVNEDSRNKLIGYFRGSDSFNPDYWKLGDIFRSNPVTIGTPSAYFMDVRDVNDAFRIFRENHQRPSNGGRIIVVGANDGQVHAFNTGTGAEVWSFIPPNFLPKLKNVDHNSDPTNKTHQYFVDGPISAADVWLGTGNGLNKSSGDWRTLLVFGEGRGGGSVLWSSSGNCDSGLSATYDLSAGVTNFCGYYALDLTDTLSFTQSTFKWNLKPRSSDAPYLGEPWSKMVMGRVKNGSDEKWVGFIGAGYNGSDCAGGGECDPRGKGFYVVDLNDGAIIWSYARGNDSTMNYSLPSTPSIVDTDNDGFIDTVYIGDLGGNMWRFKFCLKSDGDSCSVNNGWSGGKLFESSTGVIRPIFATPAVARDRNGNLWVQWGTGDKTDPTVANDQEKFYSLKDNTRNTTYHINDLDNITTGVYLDTPTKPGWYINLLNEKVLSEAAVFGGVTYFTTYNAPIGGNPCEQSGTGSLYAVNHTTGAGALAQYDAQGQPIGTPARSMVLGWGIPSAPVVSFKPVGTVQAGGSPADLYVTVSGGAGMNVSTQRVNFDPPTLANRTNILFWKDRRLE